MFSWKEDSMKMRRNDHCWGDMAGTSSSDLSNVSGCVNHCSKKGLNTIGCDCWQGHNWTNKDGGMFLIEDITSIATYGTWRILPVVEIETVHQNLARFIRRKTATEVELQTMDLCWSPQQTEIQCKLLDLSNYVPCVPFECARVERESIFTQHQG